MSFPFHDQYWMDVADFLSIHATANDDILAPKEFEYRLVHCFGYAVSRVVPVLGFEWIVVHKGQMAELAVPFLLAVVNELHPVFTNPVFVIFGRSQALPEIEDNNDLTDFHQRLRSLLQEHPPSPSLPVPSPPQDIVVPIPEPIVQATEPMAHRVAPIHNDIKVSVITVCRNAAQTIERTITAVAQQTYPNLEYIVVDGASDDGTLEICDRYAAAITKLVSEPDEGIYQAMNKGIHLATGDWLYFANADDYLFDAYVLQDLVSFILEHPNIDVVYGDHEARYPDGKTSIHGCVAPDQMLEAIVCFQSGCLLQPACLFKRTVFEQVGGFCPNYGIASDYKWFLEALQVSDLTFEYFDRTLVSYAHGGRSANIHALFQEIFEIQSQDVLCQNFQWSQKRLLALQQQYVDKYARLEEAHYRLEQVEQLQTLRSHHLIQLKQRLSPSPRTKFKWFGRG
ncbi:MAG: glycosyltransferase family 2 protein [Leptolyngbyaceae cyanobacterium]